MRILFATCVVFGIGAASYAIADASGGGLISPELNPQNLTLVGVLVFLVQRHLSNSEAKDKAFDVLVERFLNNLSAHDERYEKMVNAHDERYEKMAHECRESSERLLRQVLGVQGEKGRGEGEGR